MYKIDEELRKAFEEEVSKGLTEKAIDGLQKDLRKVADSFEDDFMWNLKDNLAYNMTAWVADMAERAVEQMLAGNDDPLIPLINARMHALLLPNAQLHVFDDGHLFLLTRAAETAEVVGEFLRAA